MKVSFTNWGISEVEFDPLGPMAVRMFKNLRTIEGRFVGCWCLGFSPEELIEGDL
jgi:hypothetical protein